MKKEDLKKYILLENNLIFDINSVQKIDASSPSIVVTVVRDGIVYEEKVVKTAYNVLNLVEEGWLLRSKSDVIGVVYDRTTYKEVVWCAGFASTRLDKVLVRGIKNIQVPTEDGYKIVWEN